ncbi:MAG TPA: glycerol-3-phosphate dehydrogenase [Gemmataceae bacterium]|nr:glycerol-3-phosphate dehydrogenase [Gemmataceae bacterium]
MRRDLDALTAEDFDLLVIGGGIVGAGAALDAATRGLRVALIDKGDFASGTSSASSKLIHGGLRYLEQGDFFLVYEALHERRRLLRNARHLVRPLRFILPFYAGARVPPWKERLGLFLYDMLAGRAGIRRSRAYPLERLHRDYPGLQRRNLHGAAEFYDAQMDDARLCITVLCSAALHGAVVANYVEAVAFEKEAGLIRGVRAADRLGGRELRIRARRTLNAAGPWVDAVRRLAGDDGGPRLRPTKGVHLVAPGRGLTAAFLLLHPADGRVFFVIPWLGKTLIGTTDTDCDDAPDQLHVAPADVEYLLRGHNHYFDPPLSKSDLLSSFVGLRPLVRARPGEPSALSREFALSASPSGLLTVSGGKYTTYRRMAETAIDAVVQRLGLHRRCRTRDLQLDGAPREQWEQFELAAVQRLQSRWALSEEDARHLIGRYGTRADDVAVYLERGVGLRSRIAPEEPDLLVEFEYQRDHEMAMTRADLLLRRTRLGLFRPELLG